MNSHTPLPRARASGSNDTRPASVPNAEFETNEADVPSNEGKRIGATFAFRTREPRGRTSVRPNVR